MMLHVIAQKEPQRETFWLVLVLDDTHSTVSFTMAVNPLIATLKATQLKELNRALGLPLSGTKPVLQSYLTNLEYRTPRRILSFDMGIRNLAFCVIEPPKDLSAPKCKQLYRAASWKRKQLEVPPSSAEFAALAKNTVSEMLEKHPEVDTILIEKQRWRSGSAPAIQQWTVAVNTFEGMLHACFACLMDPKKQRVESVDPQQVVRYWGLKDITKKNRPKVLQAMLEKKLLRIEGDTEMWEEKLSLGKKDDLTDCLMQAVAWTRWMENRRRFVEEGKLPDGII